MIFPELPKKSNWYMSIDAVSIEAKAPLHSQEQTTSIDIEAWFEQHGLPSKRIDPAAQVHSAGGKPIDWLAKDALEFYALSVAMICWTVYWYGVHRGAW